MSINVCLVLVNFKFIITESMTSRITAKVIAIKTDMIKQKGFRFGLGYYDGNRK